MRPLIRRHPILLASSVLLGLSCVSKPGRAPEPSSTEAESDAFPAVARAVLNELAARNAERPPAMRDKRPISIDPVPLRADSTVTEASLSARATITEAELASHLAVLTVLGLAPGDATQPANCGGNLLPYAPMTDHRGCPAVGRNVIAASIPWRASQRAESTLNNAAPQWRSRVVVLSIGPHGFVREIMDVVLERNGPRWRALKVITVAFYE
jgi:hypothetical protein